MNRCHKKKTYIFLHNNDCETPYIDIYIDLLSINFNLLSVLYHMLIIRSVDLRFKFSPELEIFEVAVLNMHQNRQKWQLLLGTAQ